MLKLKIVIVRCHDEQDEIKVIIITILQTYTCGKSGLSAWTSVLYTGDANISLTMVNEDMSVSIRVYRIEPDPCLPE